MIDTSRQVFSGLFSRNVARCCFFSHDSAGNNTAPLDTFAPKSHRAPHEAYEARANAPLWTPPAGLAYTFLTPSLPDHPSARETAKKKSYAHAVSPKPLMKPGGIIQQACSGAPSRVVSIITTTIAAVLEGTPNRLHRFLSLYYVYYIFPTERYNKGHTTALAPLPPTFHLHPRADPPVRDRNQGTLSKAERHNLWRFVSTA